MRYALTNGVIYTTDKALYQHAVIVNNELIEAIVPEQDLPAEIERVDLAGKNLSAGFIDLQLNGAGGVMFNLDTTVETLHTMQQTNMRYGCTSYLPTFITAPDEGIKSAVAVMREYLQDSNNANQALGLHLEGPYLSLERKGVHRPQYIRQISAEMLEFLCANSDVITKLTIAAENEAAKYVQRFSDSGILVSIGHSNANYDLAKQRIDEGISFATHLHNAMSPISSGRDMGVVGAVLESDIYTGIIVDGLHVTWSNIRFAKQIKGEKLVVVTDATAAAGADIEWFDFVGTKVIVKDGKCYDEKTGSLGGSAITMIESLQNLVEQVGIDLLEALRMCSLYPARAIGVDRTLGSIEVGKVANLTVFDHRFQVSATAVNGVLHHY
ncbi:N-acetylglucosamine-6-phosphate deacetylase [Testudinibacter sp. TR-2022]|uniref:N-acetylglucosamine-6-phosphate deacetylase n=1 Tax=Testudinibacter sp. TR-2022 TaxID=2585029 RepID=UPI0011189EBD|nr:N-acetylglucosamine-6-phosphate deacetylase [Testudinibacter sp. TR-2022]TNH04433.1 N-acetylglucosamine-6-phosphate deacetylase [Pasteurellaceae bacterium Phil31]TNH07756.1 N-acetylglucosamine-6-phosphate deacetylase [Testudinibacter sp. TR-2022]TNH12820.1 N-acetylglucosamine-6-phosphate deacetylase [Testudinibacter sp. TR-2022]TNH17381.1 N-acetylglucosamine-6-phosphate deacetylase [Testudinibacter sp. TR-2022]